MNYVWFTYILMLRLQYAGCLTKSPERWRCCWSGASPAVKKVGWTRSRRQRRRAEASRGVWNGEAVSPSPTDYGVWERRELPQRGPGQSPGRKRISVLSKRHRMPLVEMFVVLSEDVLLMEKHSNLIVSIMPSSNGRFFGKLFHKRGPAIAKPLSRNLLWVRGTGYSSRPTG